MLQAYIVDGLRLPTGKAQGYYKNVLPEQLMAEVLRDFRRRYSNLAFDELIVGNALGTGGNMARYALLEAGFSPEIPSTTLDLQCGAGLRALVAAEAQLKSGMAQSILAGGMESNSLAPRRQYQPRDPRYIDAETFYTQATFAPASYGEASLRQAAQTVAETYGLSKEELMRWTVRSHQKAEQAIEILREIRVPYGAITEDQPLRKAFSYDSLVRTQSPLLIDHTNTAHLHDGAAGIFLVNDTLRAEYEPRFRLVASAMAGGLPTLAPAGVIWATEKLLRQTGLSIQDIDLFEINESFAVKPLAFLRHWGISEEKVNIFGGNLAYGHPFGASGVINTIHLMRALAHTQQRFGLVTVGVAGGLGIALLIEHLNS
ncbi:thiolase family protein [Siphonobacter sp. BAB-5405]|uniref:thiolase family protein n=1 Tax=Siphonobacter sp. BAB-5405 TaxID=1864825 RepID=UPI001304EA18|nr:thiolase family protein [Siphonobacter sp. BAB-5405]